MNLLKLSSVLIMLAGTSMLFAQSKSSDDAVVQWSYKVMARPGNSYELQATATIKEGYHIWALDAGGDGSLIATAFDTKDDNIKWQDGWRENAKPQEHTYEFIEGAVRYFEHTVTFSRIFTVAGSAKAISGTVTFQTCNDRMCLPPETTGFEAGLP
jgi:thiol:disulfide interchange protein DsbD